MFDGDGFGLGLTVVAVDEPPLPSAPGERRARWDEVLPPESRSRAGQANELSRLQAEKGRMFAYEARLVCEFADTCEAGEFFVDELAAALGTSVTAASYAWIQSQTLHRQLPGTWAALADGELDVRVRAASSPRSVAPAVSTRPCSARWRRPCCHARSS